MVAFLLAPFSAAAGQWLHLDLLRLGLVGAVARAPITVLIGFCLLLLVASLQSGMGLVLVLALLVGTLADLAPTLTDLLAALAAVRDLARPPR